MGVVASLRSAVRRERRPEAEGSRSVVVGTAAAIFLVLLLLAAVVPESSARGSPLPRSSFVVGTKKAVPSLPRTRRSGGTVVATTRIGRSLWRVLESSASSRTSSFAPTRRDGLAAAKHDDVVAAAAGAAEEEEGGSPRLSPSDVGRDRRSFLFRSLALLSFLSYHPPSASAKSPLSKSLLFFPAKEPSRDSVLMEPVKGSELSKSLSSESCLLQLLPVKNGVFRNLERQLESVSAVRISATDAEAWKDVSKAAESSLTLLDSQRSKLAPVFNQDDPTVMQILKNERGERLIGDLRDDVLRLVNATSRRNATATYASQKSALLSLSSVGELLVPSFPYDVPSTGKFAYLPRLLGRARVTLAFRRGKEPLGNVTMIADGYAAPVTAGNFVDLCQRNFYVGLPIKNVKKRIGREASDFDASSVEAERSAFFEKLSAKLGSALRKGGKGGGKRSDDDDGGGGDKSTVSAVLPILGSFQEGFYDPLTAKPRRIPLEIVRIDRSTKVARLTYTRSFTELTSGFLTFAGSASDDSSEEEEESNDRPALTHDIPGLVVFNHPDRNLNGGSSEFFSLRTSDASYATTKAMDGRYAPFGYVIDGYDLYQELKAGDVVSATYVDEWGLLNLVKIRGSTFAEVIQSGNGDE